MADLRPAAPVQLPQAASPPVATAPAAPLMSVRGTAWALALLLGLQPVTTDVFLPALPSLQQALNAPMSQVQLTLSALMLAFGLAQLVWGPVADRFGRRPVLLCGLGLHAVASVAGAFAGSIEALVAWRALQGVALAASVVCGRALVRDLFEPAEGARVMSLALSGLGLLALASPLAGGWATGWWGWRATMAVMAAASALTLAAIAWRLPETLPETRRQPQATRLLPLLRRWWTIGKHPVFVAWTLLLSCTYGGLFIILAGSSFVYIEHLGQSPGAYGGWLALASVSYIGGTFLCRRWIGRHGVVGAVARAAGFTVGGGLLMLALALAGVQAVWAVVLPQCLYAVGHGIHQPCGQAGAVGPFPQQAGTAAALTGFALALTAFGIGLWLGRVLVSAPGSLAGGAGSQTTMLYFASGIAAWSLATGLVAWTLVRRSAR